MTQDSRREVYKIAGRLPRTASCCSFSHNFSFLPIVGAVPLSLENKERRHEDVGYVYELSLVFLRLCVAFED
jgi:hypothetical protein